MESHIHRQSRNSHVAASADHHELPRLVGQQTLQRKLLDAENAVGRREIVRDLGAGLAAGTSGGAGVWYFGKSDMWATNTGVDAVDPDLHSDTFYTAIGAGRLTVAPSGTPLAGPTGFTARQDLASASVAANLSAPSGELNVTFESAIVASDENTFMSVLRFSSSTAAPVLFDLTIAQTTVWGLPLSAGVFGGKSSPPSSPLLSWAAWAAKEGVTSTDNSLTLMPCDIRTYVIAPSTNVW